MRCVVLIAVLLGLALCQPPAGSYLSLRGDGIAGITDQLTADVINEVNSDTTAPPVTGSTSQVSYNLNTFRFTINMMTFVFDEPSANAITFGWAYFEFLIQFNFHICANSWPNPCDDGTIYIWTPNQNQKEVLVNGALSYDGSSVQFSASSVDLAFETGDIVILVDCSSTLCLIPTSDIAQAVANAFVPTFQTTVQTAVNNAAQSFINNVATSKIIPLTSTADLVLNWAGGWQTIPNLGLLFYPSGIVMSDVQGHETAPPFSPTFVPPSAVLQNPSNQASFILTDFLFHSAFWALNQDGYFTQTITNAEVSSSSPVHLLTNDSFFEGAVPGLATAYPNMELVVETQMASVSDVVFSPTGAVIDGSVLQLSFYTKEEGKPNLNFAFALNTELEITLKVVGSSNGGSITFGTSFGYFNTSTTVQKSTVGQIITPAFDQLFSALPSLTTPPSFSMAVPSGFTISQLQSSMQDRYLALTFAYTYQLP